MCKKAKRKIQLNYHIFNIMWDEYIFSGEGRGGGGGEATPSKLFGLPSVKWSTLK